VANLNLQAQVVIGETAEPQSYSVLELISNGKKGLRLPRLTTKQRDLITNDPEFLNIKKDLARGLTIYNLDSDCTEYWNGSGWTSLCQNSDPKAKMNFSNCDKIRVHGAYSQNAPLNSTHDITLPVTVTEKGSYYIVASSSNGYYFRSSGVFETTGNFEIHLDGAGTPIQSGIDNIVFSCNGEPIGTQCNVEINVKVQTMGYLTDCDNMQVSGIYQTRGAMNAENYVKIPIDVIKAGHTVFETDLINGIKFSVAQDLKNSIDTLILKAHGVPLKSGKYKFAFVTDGSINNSCSFEITVSSILGSFNDPACRCLDIYTERPDAKNGEYWLMDCQIAAEKEQEPVKTFCDLENGGWTLVWSYSERVAREVYTPAGTTMDISGTEYTQFDDVPRNRAVDENDTINYADYRVNRGEWRHFPSSMTRPQLKVRITENPTDMNDEWALNNYGIISPRSLSENPIETSFSKAVVSQGKIFGQKWEVMVVGTSYRGWDDITGNRSAMHLYNTHSYCTHWYFSRAGSGTMFQVTPNRGGKDNTTQMTAITHAFGRYNYNEANHHFGKCGGPDADDFDFTTKTCAPNNLYPHSFNNGEGRYLQWFVM
jgi:hypothetical protein